MMPMGSMMGWSGGWDMGLGAIFMLLPWVAVIVAIVAVVRWLSPTIGAAHASGGGDRALDILRERYARGEIDKQEFDAKRRDLGARSD